jgi:hypothetical protein
MRELMKREVGSYEEDNAATARFDGDGWTGSLLI